MVPNLFRLWVILKEKEKENFFSKFFNFLIKIFVNYLKVYMQYEKRYNMFF